MGEYAKTYKEIDISRLYAQRLTLRRAKIKLDIDTYKYYREELYLKYKWCDNKEDFYESYQRSLHEYEKEIKKLERDLVEIEEKLNDEWIHCGELQGYLQELRSIDGEDY